MLTMRVLAVVVGLAVCCVGGWAREAHVGASYPIVYSRDCSVYYKKGDGEAARRLAAGSYPSLSPDGKTVAFLSTYDRSSLRMLNLSSGRNRTVYQSRREYIESVSWSPRGDVLACVVVRSDYSDAGVVLLNRKGALIRRLQPSIPRDRRKTLHAVSWPRDSRSLYLCGRSHLYEVDLRGHVKRAIDLKEMSGSINVTLAAVSPTDSHIVIYENSVPGPPGYIERCGPGALGLYSFDTRTRRRRLLTPADTVAEGPSWSRDGKRIVFAGFGPKHMAERNPYHIFSIRPDSTGMVELARGDVTGK